MNSIIILLQAVPAPDMSANVAQLLAGLLGPAGVAGAMLLWVTYVMMPRQEKAAERREHACEQERGNLVAAFREECSTIRAEGREDRILDRQARHEDSNRTATGLASVELAIREIKD